VDRSGNIDEDEFGFVMEYMNVHLDGVKQEMLFNQYDKDRSGSITYDEFRQIWVKVITQDNNSVFFFEKLKREREREGNL
jgi:Ca2+-binding EF-hand superfamily protein